MQKNVDMDAGSAAAALEAYLGDPRRDDSRIGFADALKLDEAEAFPEQAVAALDAWGLPRYYVPVACGGALRSFEELSALVRCVARRDLTVAIAHAKTFLGAAPVWLAGAPAQQQRLGSAVAAGQRVALGLTEEAHGGDLFATETAALETATGYLLSGEKWLINNATRGDAITVLARTDPRGGPRGFSLFLVNKQDTAGFLHLPKISTHGIRGADISGIRFKQSPLHEDARIGGAGRGLEIIMKALQVSRTLVPALSLGALDTGLRQVLSFARGRRIGHGSVSEIPHARRILAAAFIELLAAEVVVRSGARSLHVVPERLAIGSAVVKYLVPSRVDEALRRLALVLGARHYLRGSVFEKLLRDHGLVALFDGSTVVNLCALAQELPHLVSRGARQSLDENALRERTAELHDYGRALPPFQLDRLSLMSRGGDDAPAALALALIQIQQLPDAELAPSLRQYLCAAIAQLRAELAQAAARPAIKERSLALPPESFAAAERYALLHASASCVLAWLYNRGVGGDFFACGEWLALALFQLLAKGEPPDPAWYERAFARLCQLDAEAQSLALFPIPTTTPEWRP